MSLSSSQRRPAKYCQRSQRARRADQTGCALLAPQPDGSGSFVRIDLQAFHWAAVGLCPGFGLWLLQQRGWDGRVPFRKMGGEFLRLG